MKLRGQRVLISLPKLTTTKLVLDDKTKKDLIEKQLAKSNKLEVFATGDGVDEGIKKGDFVYVPPMELLRGDMIEIEDELKIMINSLSIAIVW